MANRVFPRRRRRGAEGQADRMTDLARRITELDFSPPSDNVQFDSFTSQTTDPVSQMTYVTNESGSFVVDEFGNRVSSTTATGGSVPRVTNDMGDVLAGLDEAGDVHGRYVRASEDMEIAGVPLLAVDGHLWQRSWGYVPGTLGTRNMSGERTQDLKYGFMEINAEVRSDRTYKVVVEPFNVWNEPSATTYFRLRADWDTTVPTIASPIIETTGGRAGTAAETSLLTFGGGFLLRPNQSGTINILLCVESATGVRFPGSPLGQVTAWVEDIGPRAVIGGRDRNSRERAAGDPKPPPTEPSTPGKAGRTAEWYASNHRSYQGTSTYTWPGHTESKIVQGHWSGGTPIMGIATFGNNVDFLSGATIQSSEIRFTVKRTYNSREPAVIQVGLHGVSSPGSSRPSWTFVENVEVKAGDRGVVHLPSSLFAGIVDGTHRGISFGNLATGTGYYAHIEAGTVYWKTKFTK